MSCPFNRDDLVRISRQPPGSFLSIVGNVGYVDEITSSGDVAITILNKQGEVRGATCVPANCVEFENDTSWVIAYMRWKDRAAALAKEQEARTKKWEAALVMVAQQFNVDPETARSIYLELKKHEQR